jgi:hypothetical protein
MAATRLSPGLQPQSEEAEAVLTLTKRGPTEVQVAAVVWGRRVQVRLDRVSLAALVQISAATLAAVGVVPVVLVETVTVLLVPLAVSAFSTRT